MSGLIPSGSRPGPESMPPTKPLPGKHQDDLAPARDIIQRLGGEDAEKSPEALHAHTIKPSDPLKALARIKFDQTTVHHAELKNFLDRKTDPEAQKALAALSIPYLSWCCNHLEDALLALKSSTDAEPFLQLAHSDDLKLLREALTYLEAQEIPKLKDDWNKFYGISDSWVGRQLKWQTTFPERDFHAMLSDTKTLLEKFERVAAYAEKIDITGMEALHENKDIQTGFLELVNLQRCSLEKGAFSGKVDDSNRMDSLSVAPFLSLLDATAKLHLATTKVITNKDNELICDAAKKQYLNELAYSLRDAEDNKQELLSFLQDILRAGISPELAASVRNAIGQMRTSIAQHTVTAEPCEPWSVDLLHQDSALLHAAQDLPGVARDDQRSVFNLLNPQNDKVVTTYDHEKFCSAMNDELKTFATELERLENEFEKLVPAGTKPLDLRGKTVFDFIGDKIPPSLRARHNLRQEPYQMSETTKQILRVLFPLLQLSEKAISGHYSPPGLRAPELSSDEEQKIEKAAQQLYGSLMNPQLLARPQLLERTIKKTPALAPYVEKFLRGNLTVDEVVSDFKSDQKKLVLDMPVWQRFPEETRQVASAASPVVKSLAGAAVQKTQSKDSVVEVTTERSAITAAPVQVAITEPAPSLVEYGNKHRRLVELHDLVDSIKMEGVEVPMPYGIKSSDVHGFISKAAPSVIADWNKLGEIYATRPEGQESKSFLDRQDVSDLIKKIRQDITDAFDRAAGNPEFTKSLGFGGALDEWLDAIKKKGSYLMVRSTGDEDSSYANAGGNVSEAYVPTTPEDILKAAGKVVASYFSIPSLANRLNARANPFASELKLAVTMQELIGESPDGRSKEVPVSLVLFTNEPNYGGNEQFRIMRLSATHGHGEAVVGNRGIATDSYYLLQSRVDPDDIYIVSDIKEKPQRLAPVRGSDGKVRLEKKENTKEMASSPAFNKDMLVRLFALGKQVEARYGGQPTDMEIVVKGNTIYPVQARPVNRPVPKPSYVDPSKVAALEKTPITRELRGNTQVSGAADALVIRNANEILVTTTLEDAENNFHLGQHKLVVIKEPEPADSHFVVNFAGLGIPCIQMDEINSIQQEIGRLGSSYSLVADIQDASIKVWDNSKATPESCISQGYLSHPAHVTISLDVAHLPPLGKGDKAAFGDLQEIIRQVKVAATSELAHKTIQELCARPELQALSADSARLFQQLEELHLPSLRGRVALRAANELDAKMRRACAEAIGETEERLETLFHAKVLEQLTFQPPLRDGSLGKLSLVTATKLLRDTEEIIAYARSLGRQARLADLVVDAQQAPLAQTKQLWISALKTLETCPPELQPKLDTLLKLVDLLRDTNSLGTWLTLMLQSGSSDSPVWPISMIRSRLSSANPNPEELLDHLLAGMTEERLKTMQKLQDEASSIRSMRQEIPNFADPETFQASWERLRAMADSYKQPEKLNKLHWIGFNNLPATLLVQATLNDIVDLYDKSIKSLKASSKYSDPEKIAKFREMVEGYRELFDSWVRNLVNPLDLRADFDEYLMRLHMQTLMAPETSNTLKPSQSFEVPPALITAGTAFNRHLPQTTEDAFTLIHQDLLEITTILSKDHISINRLKQLPTSKTFKDALDSVRSLGNAQILGVDVDSERVVVRFNLPIRNHSSTFQIVFDAQKHETIFQFQFLGQARARWGYIKERLDILDVMGKIHLTSTPVWSPSALDLRCRLDDETLGQVFRSTRAMIAYTNSGSESDLVADGLPTIATLHKEVIDRYIDRLINSPRAEDLSHLVIELVHQNDVKNLNPKVIQGLERLALERYVRSDNPTVMKRGFELLIYLVGGGHDYQEAMAIATEGFKNENREIKATALRLFNALVEKGEAYPQAIGAAKIGITSDNWEVQTMALRLFNNLVKKDLVYLEAIDAAQAGIKNDFWSVRDNALSLFNTLFEKGLGYQEAIAVAEEGFKNENQKIRETALGLFKALFEKGEAYPQAIGAAKIGITSDNWEVQATALSLFSALFKKGQGYQEALALATESFKDEKPQVKVTDISLFKDLFEKGLGYQEAIALATESFKNENPEVKSTALKLFNALVEKGLGYQEAIGAATEGFKNEHPVVKTSAIDVFKALVEKDQGYQKALEAVAEGIESDNGYIKRNSLGLLPKIRAAVASKKVDVGDLTSLPNLRRFIKPTYYEQFVDTLDAIIKKRLGY